MVNEGVRPDRGAELFARSFSSGLEAIAQLALPVVQAEREEQGKREAYQDVDNGKFAPRGRFFIRDRAYNRAGLTAIAADVESEGVTRIRELSQEHAANPLDPQAASVTVVEVPHGQPVTGERQPSMHWATRCANIVCFIQSGIPLL